MKPLMHIGLLLMALLGVMGQSTAIAMIPASVAAVSVHQTTQVSMADMDCMDMVSTSAPRKPPCEKVTPQCMEAMGCASFALVAPAALQTFASVDDRCVPNLPLTARLWGRTYGPEPDPPSFPI